ncbi:MAG TPA: ZIP family metal transporter [Bacteroidia bacterium]|nr:ZIP family metal transporter [Bacteroidia bacterium]
MGVFEYILLFASVMISGSLFFMLKKTNPVYLKLSLAFTGSYLFTISMIHLVPGVFSSGGSTIGYYILIGFFIQLFLEHLTGGIEHGHIHLHQDHHHSFPFTMMAGLCLHSFLEGMPLASGLNGHHDSEQLLTGIILHHLPVSFALVSMLTGSGVNKKGTLVYLAVFALMAPAGAFVSEFLSGMQLLDIHLYFDRIMGVVIGIFLHISTTILFETSSEHRFNLYKMAVILLGAAAVILF